MNRYNLNQCLRTRGLDLNCFNDLIGVVIKIALHPIDNVPLYTLKITEGLVNLGSELVFCEENLAPYWEGQKRASSFRVI